ncbi:hypothetical protein BJV82DRAFT_583862 [Fennellomyces sp. T-0311]|nr:hypothetical protein BJV82DRAFT_583862 [Fennellomyces sp. T-0311]
MLRHDPPPRNVFVDAVPLHGHTETSAQLVERIGNCTARAARQTTTSIAILGSPEHVYTLLAVAEQHSQALGYRWHPAKCPVIDSGPTRYTLNSEPLAKVA